MSVLSDSIEQFIIELMQQNGEVNLQRNELAQHFSCVPSQINYVLSTRFTLERGYVIVSRRGGGGYIRIIRVDMDRDSLLHQMATALSAPGGIGQREALSMILRLYDDGSVSQRDAALMQAAVSGCNLPTAQLGNTVRANVLRSMLLALMQD